LAATGALMILLRAAHPPAGATTLIVSLGLATEPVQLLMIDAAVAVMTLQAVVINRLAGHDYPLWSRSSRIERRSGQCSSNVGVRGPTLVVAAHRGAPREPGGHRHGGVTIGYGLCSMCWPRLGVDRERVDDTVTGFCAVVARQVGRFRRIRGRSQPGVRPRRRPRIVQRNKAPPASEPRRNITGTGLLLNVQQSCRCCPTLRRS